MAEATRRVHRPSGGRQSSKPVRQVRGVPPGRPDYGSQVVIGIGLGIGFFVGQTLMQVLTILIAGWLQ